MALKILNRCGGSFSKVSVPFTFLSLSQSIFDRFSKFFFPLKVYENCNWAKYWVRNGAPCAPASTVPDHKDNFQKNPLGPTSLLRSLVCTKVDDLQFPQKHHQISIGGYKN